MSHIKKSIAFLKKVSSVLPDLHLAFSGGKDSLVLYALACKAKISFHPYYCNTTIDPPGTIAFIRDHYPLVEILQPQETFYQLVSRKGFPTRMSRFCCQYLKEYASIGKNVLEGVRSCESKGRQNRDYIQCDSRSWQKGSQHIYPIYDWSDKQVWAYIQDNDIMLPPHYHKGFDRLGCVACPLISSAKKRAIELETYPNFYQALYKAIDRGMINNPQWKLSQLTGGDPAIALKWWLSGLTMDNYFFNKL